MTEDMNELRELEKKVGKFFYLMNAMELAGMQENPAKHDYFLKRLEVFRHVAKLVELGEKAGRSEKKEIQDGENVHSV